MRSDQAAAAQGDAPLLYSVDDAAKLLGIGRTVTYRLLMTGRLMSVKVGGRRLGPRTSIESFVSGLLEDPE